MIRIVLRRPKFHNAAAACVIAATCSAVQAQSLDASRDEAIRKALRQFDRNPRATLDAPLERFDGSGNAIVESSPFTRAPSKDASELIHAKNALRLDMVARAAPSFDDAALPPAEIKGNDRPEELVDVEKVVDDLTTMDRLKLRKAKLTNRPWSSYHWPTWRGLLAYRYQEMPLSNNWYGNFTFFQQNPTADVVATGDDEAIDRLSPAEKYDLVLGSSNFTLTKAMWAEGRKLSEKFGEVADWAGVCDGWAAASIMMPRAARTVTIPSPLTKGKVSFTPADTQALASLLWARTNKRIKHIGGRCDLANPARDPDTGRISDPDCFDTNPGAWHIAVVNQLGRARRSLVLDAIYDQAIWNYPAVAYSYSYFNPSTKEPVDSLKKARVSLAKWTGDKFRKFRGANARYVVGIAMDLTYTRTTQPTPRAEDHGKDDASRTVRYLYDLELDAKGHIVGGEWYTNSHPDFLWVPEIGAKAHTPFERWARTSWNLTTEVPRDWRYAADAASKRSQPLAKFVYMLLEKAKR